MSEPTWLALARAELGVSELAGPGNNPAVVAYYAAVGRPDVKHDAVAWCAAFAGSVLRRAGMRIPAPDKALLARAYLRVGTQIEDPTPGCLAIFQRGDSKWQGHVGFYVGRTGDQIHVLGGNQSDSVSIARYSESKLIAYIWPEKETLSSQIAARKEPVTEMINFSSQTFFTIVRRQLFGGKLTQAQVDGLNVLLGEWQSRMKDGHFFDLRWLAYIMATAFHETGSKMEPVEEIGKGKGKDYGLKVPFTGHAYYGRGYVQITWLDNYRKASDKIGVDFVRQPSLALQPKYAVKILFNGMLEGWFSKGNMLAKFFNSNLEDWEGARAIVNGDDRASEIGEYGRKFMAALEATAAARSKLTSTAASTAGTDLEQATIQELIAELTLRYGATSISVTLHYEDKN